MSSLFIDGPEFQKRKTVPFKPTKVTMSELHKVVPKDLYEKSTWKGLLYVTRDITSAYCLFKLGLLIDPTTELCFRHFGIISPWTAGLIRWSLWSFYWFWQGIVLTGWWTLAHEAGHGTLSPHKWFNHVVGFSLHTFLLVPYFAWRSTHNSHHKATASVEREEHFVPRTRSHYGLPPQKVASAVDYEEILEETPIFTLARLIFMQVFGWQCYLFFNTLGSPSYPAWTNHFFPNSALFKPHERSSIIISDIGIAAMMYLLYSWSSTVGLAYFVKLYLIPYTCTNHWIVMMVYLQHCDPTVPQYRKGEWTFLRGALSSIDRPFMGWIGEVFFHNASHNHISHHLFSSIPFYNQPLVTEHIKAVLKDDYTYDSTNVFRALYRSFTECCFIEDEGDIVFCKNKRGEAAREVDSVD